MTSPLPYHVIADRYELRERLNSNYLGQIWLAWDRRERAVVRVQMVKDMQLWPQARTILPKFIALGSSAAARVLDFVEAEGAGAIVLEHCAGTGLADHLAAQRGRVCDVDKVAAWSQSLLDFLERLHGELQLAHGQLRVDQLVIDPAGHIRLLDPGLMGALAPEPPRELHLRATYLGALVYVSPQRLEGQAASSSDDMYAVGSIMYEMLTGGPLFTGGTLVMQIRHRHPEAMHQVRQARGVAPAELPPGWEDLVMGCLAKDRESRPPNAMWVNDRLEQLMASVKRTGRFTVERARQNLTQLAGRLKLPEFGFGRLAVLGSAIVLLLAVGGWYAWSDRHPQGATAANPVTGETQPTTAAAQQSTAAPLEVKDPGAILAKQDAAGPKLQLAMPIAKPETTTPTQDSKATAKPKAEASPVFVAAYNRAKQDAEKFSLNDPAQATKALDTWRAFVDANAGASAATNPEQAQMLANADREITRIKARLDAHAADAIAKRTAALSFFTKMRDQVATEDLNDLDRASASARLSVWQKLETEFKNNKGAVAESNEDKTLLTTVTNKVQEWTKRQKTELAATDAKEFGKTFAQQQNQIQSYLDNENRGTGDKMTPPPSAPETKPVAAATTPSNPAASTTPPANPLASTTTPTSSPASSATPTATLPSKPVIEPPATSETKAGPSMPVASSTVPVKPPTPPVEAPSLSSPSVVTVGPSKPETKPAPATSLVSSTTPAKPPAPPAVTPVVSPSTVTTIVPDKAETKPMPATAIAGSTAPTKPPAPPVETPSVSSPSVAIVSPDKPPAKMAAVAAITSPDAFGTSSPPAPTPPEAEMPKPSTPKTETVGPKTTEPKPAPKVATTTPDPSKPPETTKPATTKPANTNKTTGFTRVATKPRPKNDPHPEWWDNPPPKSKFDKMFGTFREMRRNALEERNDPEWQAHLRYMEYLEWRQRWGPDKGE